MELAGLVFQGLEKRPVELSGEWADGASRDWRGKAIATVPLVGMSFLQSSRHCGWSKSERDESTPEVRLALFPHNSANVDVQVSFSVGHGFQRWRSQVASPTYRPILSTLDAIQTGQVVQFAVVEGEPTVTLFALFLARSDVESSRNTLWRVRKRLESVLDEPLRHCLTHGRTGTL
jgi:hypothetical protein